MTCPKCAAPMDSGQRGGVTVAKCTSCEGIFLERADRADLIDHETEWHASRSAFSTQPLPRITSDMAAPPASAPSAAHRSYIDALFG